MTACKRRVGHLREITVMACPKRSESVTAKSEYTVLSLLLIYVTRDVKCQPPSLWADHYIIQFSRLNTAI